MGRLRYAIVGLGSRAQMYVDACVGAHKDVAELVDKLKNEAKVI